MAPTFTKLQARGLFNFLGSHQKITLLQIWVNTRVKAEELKVDMNSFRQMRAERVLPKRLGKIPGRGNDIDPFTDSEDRAISQLIKDTSDRKEAAFARAAENWSTLNRAVSTLRTERPTLMNDIRGFCNMKVKKAREDKQKKADHNLKTLIRDSKWEQVARPGAVVDMSNRRLNIMERKLLSLGLKFSTGLNERTPLDVATSVNKFRTQHAHDPRVPDLAFIRASVIPYLDTERHTTLPERYLKAFRSLQGKKDLTILPADKGGAVGVLRTTKYYALGLGVLQDTTQFKPVDEEDKEGRDVATMQAAHNRKIKAIGDKVTDKDMKSVIKKLVSPPTPLMPSLTAYPKLHKNPVTARPVISNIKAPHSRSSKWAADVLSGYVGLISDAHIKSTRDFYTRIKMCRAKGKLLSLDIKSLFTNIPVDEAIEVIRAHSTGPDPTFKNLPIEPDLFCDILSLCTSYNQFTFGDQCYRQITGVPMGSSLSPVLANIYMEHFEANLLGDIPIDIRPSIWMRYVDDIFCCFEDMTKFEDFLERLNGIRPSIQFTYELSRTDSHHWFPRSLNTRD